jgi:hypothetical protein
MKILIGLVAALVVAAGGYFGFEYYAQQRIAADVEAAFATVRASGAKASHGKVSFDFWSKTVTVADIAGEFTADPPASVRIGRIVATGVSQPGAGRFAASRIEATDVEVSGTIGSREGLRASYQAPRIEIADYAGPAGPMRPLDSKSPAEIYRFALKHFASVTAKSVGAPALTMKLSPATSGSGGLAGEYKYSGLALTDIKDGKIASATVERAAFTATVAAAGKSETVSGDIANLAAYDFDTSAVLKIFDPAAGKDDAYYRAYRQVVVGSYTATLPQGVRMRLDGMTIDDVGLRPSRLQFPALMAVIDAAPPPGTTPTTEQMRDLLDKAAELYEGIRIGRAELRGLTMDTLEGGFRVGKTTLANLENGKLGEFAIEGIEGKAPQGPVQVGRFALKSLDLANLMRVSAQFATGRDPSPDQLVALLLLLEGTEISQLVAPYKDSGKPVTIETLNVLWGQFVGSIPTRARVTVKMNGPIDISDPDPFRMLALAGLSNASVNFDLGAAWNESARSFALSPATLEVSNVATATARLSLSNVQRGTFSLNPLQAAIMAAQIEAGPLEIVVHDTGGIDLAIAQQARQQNISPDAARRAITDGIRDGAMKLAPLSPDAMAIAGALTRFVESPRGTLTIRLTPKGRVAMMQLLDLLKGNPFAALTRFQVEATTGR